MTRTIKRYDNRKLYDVDAKRYVRLSDLADMIRAGEDVAVVNNNTGSDLTAQTLAKILSDGDDSRSASSLSMISSGGEKFLSVAAGSGSISWLPARSSGRLRLRESVRN